MMSTGRLRYLTIGLLAAVAVVGCDGAPEPGAADAAESTSGSEGGWSETSEAVEETPAEPEPTGESGVSAEAPASEPVAPIAAPATTPAAEAPPEESPWGATRSEQCRPAERHAMNASARAKFAEAGRLAAAGDGAGAAEAFLQTLRADPDAFQAAYNLGVLSARGGRTAEAFEYYRQSLRIQGDYEEAVRGMVTIYVRQGSLPDAYAFTQPLSRRYPTNLHIQSIYAEVLVRMGRYDAAWEAARRALRCDERFVPAMIALIKASRAQARDELADSILEQALAVDPNNAELHFLRGTRLLAEDGHLRDALVELRRAVELRSDFVDARVALGEQLLAAGNYAEALQQFEVAAELAPRLLAIRLSLADALRANRRWERSKAEFERVLQMDSSLAQAHFGLGLLYLSAAGEFPGMSELEAMQAAVRELTEYRNLMGPRLPRDDQSAHYLTDLERSIQRLQRRLEREARSQASADGGGES